MIFPVVLSVPKRSCGSEKNVSCTTRAATGLLQKCQRLSSLLPRQLASHISCCTTISGRTFSVSWKCNTHTKQSWYWETIEVYIHPKYISVNWYLLTPKPANFTPWVPSWSSADIKGFFSAINCCIPKCTTCSWIMLERWVKQWKSIILFVVVQICGLKGRKSTMKVTYLRSICWNQMINGHTLKAEQCLCFFRANLPLFILVCAVEDRSTMCVEFVSFGNYPSLVNIDENGWTYVYYMNSR